MVKSIKADKKISLQIDDWGSFKVGDHESELKIQDWGSHFVLKILKLYIDSSQDCYMGIFGDTDFEFEIKLVKFTITFTIWWIILEKTSSNLYIRIFI